MNVKKKAAKGSRKAVGKARAAKQPVDNDGPRRLTRTTAAAAAACTDNNNKKKAVVKKKVETKRKLKKWKDLYGEDGKKKGKPAAKKAAPRQTKKNKNDAPNDNNALQNITNTELRRKEQHEEYIRRRQEKHGKNSTGLMNLSRRVLRNMKKDGEYPFSPLVAFKLSFTPQSASQKTASKTEEENHST